MSWTHIDDGLPPIGTRVLFTMEDPESGGFHCIEIGIFQGAWTKGHAIVMDCEFMDGDWSPATHWMQLPALPEKKASQ